MAILQVNRNSCAVFTISNRIFDALLRSPKPIQLCSTVVCRSNSHISIHIIEIGWWSPSIEFQLQSIGSPINCALHGTELLDNLKAFRLQTLLLNNVSLNEAKMSFVCLVNATYPLATEIFQPLIRNPHSRSNTQEFNQRFRCGEVHDILFRKRNESFGCPAHAYCTIPVYVFGKLYCEIAISTVIVIFQPGFTSQVGIYGDKHHNVQNTNIFFEYPYRYRNFSTNINIVMSKSVSKLRKSFFRIQEHLARVLHLS